MTAVKGFITLAPGVMVFEAFFFVTHSQENKLECLSPTYFHTSLIFWVKPKPYPQILDKSKNNLAVNTNVPAYFGMTSVTNKKSFIKLSPNNLCTIS